MVENFLKGNAKWLLILLFTGGGLYNEFKHLKEVETRLATEVIQVESRLDKKIKIIAEHEDEIQQLKTKISVLEERIKCNQ